MLGDARHHLNRLKRVSSGGGFAGQHQRIGAVEDGVGDVGDFGAGRARITDHRIEHLRRGDDGLADAVAGGDDALLRDRDLFNRHFDTEIAARNHRAIGDIENRFQILAGLELFDLDDDRNDPPGFAHYLTQRQHIVGAFYKGEGDVIDSKLQPKPDIVLVLLGHGIDIQPDTGRADALLRSQRSTGDHARFEFRRRFGDHDQLQQSVVEQQTVAGRDGGEKLGNRQLGALLRANDRLTGQDKPLVATQSCPGCDIADADLRPAQILHYRDTAAGFGTRLLHGLEARAMLVVGPVRKVESGDIHARARQLRHLSRFVHGRTEGADNLCASHRG